LLLFSTNPSTNSIATLILGGREYCECKEKGTSVYGLRHGPIDNTTPAFVGDNTNASGDMTKHSSSVHIYVATFLKETILIDVLVQCTVWHTIPVLYSCIEAWGHGNI